MLYSPQQASPIQLLRHKYALHNSTQQPIAQHELFNVDSSATHSQSFISLLSPTPTSLLLRIPGESLTHITSSLDPPSLLALSAVNRILYGHVKDDNTWYRAFAYQLLGIYPEHDLGETTSLMLRRSESSWRREFISRFSLQKQWELSINTTITHIPHHSTINAMHIMPSDFLLTSSLQYGIVSRSNPFTGKILRGYLDASGTGLGVGNPNAEFTPNVSSCAVTSQGGTAKILWGLITGDVRVITAARATDPRASSQMVRCNVADEHHGAVLDAIWDETKPDRAVTGGLDGRVKVWDTKLVECLWTSQPKSGDWCLKVASALSAGVVACAMLNGDIVVWTRLGTTEEPQEIRVPCPVQRKSDSAGNEPPQVRSLYVDAQGQGGTSVLIAYANEPTFFRVKVDVITDVPELTKFGNPDAAIVSCVRPFFAPSSSPSKDRSFVVTGDQLGCVSIYDWNAPSNSAAYTHKFEAFKDGSTITALAWNSVALLVGSASGSVKVFDALTFAHLRTFTTNPEKTSLRAAGHQQRERGGQRDRVKDAVSGILLGEGRDTMFVSAGARVVAFKAGPVTWNNKGGRGGGVRGRNTSGSPMSMAQKRKGRSGNVGAKYFKQLELEQSITESKKILDMEQSARQESYGREKQQRNKLDAMGLSEQEAVQYLIMLSREEEERRLIEQRGGERTPTVQEGVFDGDFDFGDDGFFGQSSRAASGSGFPSGATDGVAISDLALLTPTLPSSAGAGSRPVNVPGPGPSFGLQDETHFPSISPSNSSVASTPSPISRGASLGVAPSTSTSSSSSGSSVRGGTSSPGKGVWASPSPSVRKAGSSSSNSNSGSPSTSLSAYGRGVSRASGSASASRGAYDKEDEMDEDLRYAIELSKAEF